MSDFPIRPFYAVCPILWSHAEVFGSKTEWWVSDPFAYFVSEIDAKHYGDDLVKSERIDFFLVVSQNSEILHELSKIPKKGVCVSPKSNFKFLPNNLIEQIVKDLSFEGSAKVEKLKLELSAMMDRLAASQDRLTEWIKTQPKIGNVTTIDERGERLFLRCALIEKIIACKNNEIAELESQN